MLAGFPAKGGEGATKDAAEEAPLQVVLRITKKSFEKGELVHGVLELESKSRREQTVPDIRYESGKPDAEGVRLAVHHGLLRFIAERDGKKLEMCKGMALMSSLAERMPTTALAPGERLRMQTSFNLRRYLYTDDTGHYKVRAVLLWKGKHASPTVEFRIDDPSPFRKRRLDEDSGQYARAAVGYYLDRIIGHRNSLYWNVAQIAATHQGVPAVTSE